MAIQNFEKLTITGVSRLLRYAHNDGEKSYPSKIWRRSVYRNLTNSKLGWYSHVLTLSVTIIDAYLESVK